MRRKRLETILCCGLAALTLLAATVAISTGGRADFPLTAERFAENPPVLTNVPEGKLTLSVAMRVAQHDGGTEP